MENKIGKLLDWIKEEKKDIISCIIERAIMYNKDACGRDAWLFDSSILDDNFIDWGEEDLENHNWDLSRLKTLEEIQIKLLRTILLEDM